VPGSVVYALMAELLMHKCVQQNAVAACTLTSMIPSFLRAHALHRCTEGVKDSRTVDKDVLGNLHQWGFCLSEYHKELCDLLKLDCWSPSATVCMQVCIRQFLEMCAADATSECDEEVDLKNAKGCYRYVAIGFKRVDEIVELDDTLHYVSVTGDVSSVETLFDVIRERSVHRLVDCVSPEMKKALENGNLATTSWKFKLEMYSINIHQNEYLQAGRACADMSLKRGSEARVEPSESEEARAGAGAGAGDGSDLVVQTKRMRR